MVDESTARLALPLLQAGQAQKEMSHNEALTRLDLAVHACAVTEPLDIPPAEPSVGACWIVGTDPTGDWATHAGALAGWTQGGWRFVAPREGMAVWIATSRTIARFSSDLGWIVGTLAGARVLVDGLQVVGARRSAIADPTGGATIDAEARAAIGAVLNALREHGLIHAE